MNMMQSEHRTDPGLATALRISVSRLARRLRVERAAAGLGEPDLSETQLAALATLERRLNELSPAERTTLRAAAPILEKLSQS